MIASPLHRLVMAFLVAFRSLRGRNYRMFWIGQMTSTMGMWAGEVALSWLVLEITNSPAMLGLSVTIRFLPSLLLSPFGGVLADRWPKRSVILVTQSCQLLASLALAVLTGTGLISVATIFALAVLRGTADALDMPARQAFVVELVGTEHVANAVALNSLQFNLGRVVGPMVGALLMEAVGIASCFYLNAATFLFVIASLVAMRPSQLHLAAPAAKAPVLAQMREATGFSIGTPDVALIFLLVFSVATFGYNFVTVLPLLARYVLDSGPAGLGALTTSLGLGSMLSAMWMAYRGTPTRRLLLGAAACFATLLLCLGFAGRQTTAMALLVGLGICGILFVTTANTRLQLLAPGPLRGRVMGLYTWVCMGMTPLGSLLVGWLAEWNGTRAMVLETAGLCATGVVAGLLYAHRHRRGLVSLRSALHTTAPVEDQAA